MSENRENMSGKKSYSPEDLAQLLKCLSENPGALEAAISNSVHESHATKNISSHATKNISSHATNNISSYATKNISSQLFFRPAASENSATPKLSQTICLKRKAATPAKEQYPEFTRKVIFVEPDCFKVPTGKLLKNYRIQKRICDTAFFQKKLTEVDIKEKIKKIFKNHIKNDENLDILIEEDGDLVHIDLEPGLHLTGDILAKNTKTVFFARVHSQEVRPDSDVSDADAPDTDVFSERPQSSVTLEPQKSHQQKALKFKSSSTKTSPSINYAEILSKEIFSDSDVEVLSIKHKEVLEDSADVVTSSDDDVFLPKRVKTLKDSGSRGLNGAIVKEPRGKKWKKQTASESNLSLPGTSSSNSSQLNGKIVAATPTGPWYFTDELGVCHKLEDVEVEDMKISINEIITSCNSLIKSCEVKRISISRGPGEDVLKQLRSELQAIKPFSSLVVRFTKESGVGSGPLREMFSLALQGIHESNLLEGDDYAKSLTNKLEGIRSGAFHDIGQIIALSIVHNGPCPVFFTNVFFRLLFDLDVHAVLTDITDANVKDELRKVQEATTCSAANVAMLNCSVFASAGTYCQLSSENFEDEKKIALEDAIEWYAVKRIQEPVRKLREGFNKDFNLLERLKTCDMEKVKLLFCRGSTSALTAEKVKGVFKVSTEDQKSVAYKYWLKYLNYLESKNSDAPVQLKHVLFCATGEFEIPPLGYPTWKKPYITFMPYTMPKGKSCFNQLILPTLNGSYFDFQTMMDTGIQFGDRYGEP